MTIGQADSGLRYAIRRSSGATAWCSLSIGCGARDEEGFGSGIAHFAEHCIFKGTARRSSRVINSCLERLGGELNAYTTKEEIVIHSATLKEDFGTALDLILDLAAFPAFPDSEVAKERGVVADEIKACKDSPSEEIFDKFEELYFGPHPLGRPVLGSVQSVRRLDGEQLRRFAAEKFHPGNMALCLVADIDEKKAEEALLRRAARFFPSAAGQPPGRKLLPAYKRAGFETVRDKRHHEANYVLGGPAPSLYDEKERMAAFLLGNILAGPAANSLLNNLLREKNGWVYGVESNYSQYSDTGLMTLSLGCERANLDKCVRAVRGVLDKLASKALSPQKLKAAKRQALGQLALSSDNGEAQCLSMGKSLLAWGTVHSDERGRELIQAVSSAQLQEAAERIFAPESLCSLTYL